MERGALDCALYADEVIPQDFHYRPLFRDGFALVCRAPRALARQQSLSALKLLNAAAAFPQFALRYAFGRGHVTDDVYRRLGLDSPQMCLEAPYFYAGACAWRGSCRGVCVAIVPGLSPMGELLPKLLPGREELQGFHETD